LKNEKSEARGQRNVAECACLDRNPVRAGLVVDPMGLLEPSADAGANVRDARWTTQRAVGSDAFVAPYLLGSPWPTKTCEEGIEES